MKDVHWVLRGNNPWLNSKVGGGYAPPPDRGGKDQIATVQRTVPLLLIATMLRVAVPPEVAAGTITTA